MATTKSTQGGVSVVIDGAGANGAEYDETEFLRAEDRLRSELSRYLATGARVDNLAEVIAQVLDEELPG